MLEQLSLITITLFIPMIGLSILLFMPEKTAQDRANIRWTAFGFTLAAFVASLLMLTQFDNAQAGYQLVQRVPWLVSDTLNISYYVGVDGISMLMVLLTTFIIPIAVFSSFRAHVIEERGREKLYYIFMLLLEWAMIGVFVSLDLVTFYIFWEVTLVPMYFLVGIWGGEQRVYAAVKFFLYTMAGSILMLLAILYLGVQAKTFALPDILTYLQATPILFDGLFSVQSFLFLGFFIAFAIKVPLWPFHSWLPDAHVQAPTAGSVVLAGVLLKMGTYGFVRFNLPLFPESSVAWAPIICGLAVIGIIYGAWVSYAQKDVKKLVAYSSVSHMGFIVLGIFALNSIGIQGATLQMINHGVSTGGLFLLVGMLYERRHTKAIDAFGGIWKALPLFGAISLVVTLSSMGLPGLNGFVGEFLILMGSMGSTVLGIGFTVFATTGIILAAVYMLYMYQKVYMGELDKEENKNLPPMHWQEVAVMVPILVMIFWIGLQPSGFFAVMDAAATGIANGLQPAIEAIVLNLPR
jgi:NADH-quinone oxidoreductase subunit M